jgi:hypothetical protein
MSERERWIIYPLLFLALGAALRDKLIDTTMSRKIVCQELIVADDSRPNHEPRPVARIGAGPSSDGGPAPGQLIVDELRVGTIAADNYVYRGVPFTPGQRAVLQGVSPADLLRALQQSAQALQDGATPGTPSQPAATPSVEQPPPSSQPPADETHDAGQ